MAAGASTTPHGRSGSSADPRELHQISAIHELVDEAERGTVSPGDGLTRLHEIRAMRPRRGPLTMLLAYATMTTGLCLVLQPTPWDVAIATGLGAIVGALVLAAREHRTLTVLVPVLAAGLVAALSFQAVEHGIADPGLRTMIAPLVTLLPGGVLTTATMELAAGEMVAGASRLVFGSVQMLLLAFGIVAGVELAGHPSSEAVSDVQTNLLGWWAPWLGVIVFGLAAAQFFSAPGGALPWLMVVLLAAWVGQLIGGTAVGDDVSGFFGALVMTPVALAIGRLGGPPPQVTFLPAFWLLVPGAIGLIGVTEVVGNPAAAGIEDLVAPLGAIVSIALGVLAGVSLPRAIPLRRTRPGSRP